MMQGTVLLVLRYDGKPLVLLCGYYRANLNEVTALKCRSAQCLMTLTT
jgi:hypothetical protein